MMKLRLATPEHLVDIDALAGELGYIREEGDEVRIGAMTRHRAILESELLARRLAIFTDAERVIADPVVRNRGTIGGALCQADPHLVALLADVPELAGERVDVHEVLRRREPQLHHRQERVPAGQQSGVGPKPRQQVERVLDAGGALVLERSRDLHVSPLDDAARGTLASLGCSRQSLLSDCL